MTHIETSTWEILKSLSPLLTYSDCQSLKNEGPSWEALWLSCVSKKGVPLPSLKFPRGKTDFGFYLSNRWLYLNGRVYNLSRPVLSSDGASLAGTQKRVLPPWEGKSSQQFFRCWGQKWVGQIERPLGSSSWDVKMVHDCGNVQKCDIFQSLLPRSSQSKPTNRTDLFSNLTIPQLCRLLGSRLLLRFFPGFTASSLPTPSSQKSCSHWATVGRGARENHQAILNCQLRNGNTGNWDLFVSA